MEKKLLFFVAALFCSSIAFSQVGINTPNPQGIFHVDGAKDNPATGTPTAVQQTNDVVVTSAGAVGVGTTTPNSTLQVNGNVASKTAIVTTAPYTVLSSDSKIIWNGSVNPTGNHIILPDPTTCAGRELSITNISDFEVRVSNTTNGNYVGFAGDWFVSSTNGIILRLVPRNGEAKFYSDGTRWIVASSNSFPVAFSNNAPYTIPNGAAIFGSQLSASDRTFTLPDPKYYHGKRLYCHLYHAAIGGNTSINTYVPAATGQLRASDGSILASATLTGKETDYARALDLYSDGQFWFSSGSAGASSLSVTVDCSSGTNGFNGTYVPGSAATAATYVVTLTNSTFFSASIQPSVSDLTLSGASGLTVTSVSPSTPQTLGGGGNLVITYTLGGTVPSSGTVTANYAKNGATCTSNLELDKAPAYANNNEVLNTCSNANTTAGVLYTNWVSATPANITVNASTGLVTGAANTGTSVISANVDGSNYKLGRIVTTRQRVYNFFTTTYGGADLSGSWNPSTAANNVTNFIIEVWGGGAAGNNTFDRSGGGGAGAYSKKTFAVASGSVTYTAGAPVFHTTNGRLSTATYNGTTIIANGGATSTSSIGGSGGTATGGDINTNGGNGTNGFCGGSCVNGDDHVGGNGGSSPNGGAGGLGATGGNISQNGFAPGGGGGGKPLAAAGGNAGHGSRGEVRITITCP